jgi:hypothetical protein
MRTTNKNNKNKEKEKNNPESTQQYFGNSVKKQKYHKNSLAAQKSEMHPHTETEGMHAP